MYTEPNPGVCFMKAAKYVTAQLWNMNEEFTYTFAALPSAQVRQRRFADARFMHVRSMFDSTRLSANVPI